MHGPNLLRVSTTDARTSHAHALLGIEAAQCYAHAAARAVHAAPRCKLPPRALPNLEAGLVAVGSEEAGSAEG